MQSRKGKVEDLTITINKSPTVSLLAFLLSAEPWYIHKADPLLQFTLCSFMFFISWFKLVSFNL